MAMSRRKRHHIHTEPSGEGVQQSEHRAHAEIRHGLWLAFVGVALELVGLSWDAQLHRFNPDLAQTEGVFTLSNPSHALFMLGVGLTVAGVLLELLLLARARPSGPGWRIGPALSSLALVGLAGAALGTALISGGVPISSNHPHTAEAAVERRATEGMVDHPSPDQAGTEQQHADHPAIPSNDPTIAALQVMLREQGTEQALAQLEELAARDQQVLSRAHDIAHSLGKYSFAHYRSAQVAFGNCRETFQSGCYHGVMEAYFEANPNVQPTEVTALCGSVAADTRYVVRFQCLHGLGHGLTFHFEHDIMQALDLCDYLATEWDRSSCYGGVFMENVIFNWQQRFGTPEQMHHQAGDHKIFVKPGDPLYPCNALAERYLRECYMMQSSVVLMFNGYDFAKAFKACDTAPSQYVSVCYQSMGRDISGHTLRDGTKSLQLCMLGNPTHRAFCFVGAVKNFIDIDWRIDKGLSFCASVPEDSKWTCNRAIGEQVASIHPEPNRKAAECARVEPRYVDACAAGAGLSQRS